MRSKCLFNVIACKVVAAALLSLLITSCASSAVGGSRTSIANQPAVTKDYCLGGCTEFSPNGRCIRFTDDIADVCARYLDRKTR